MFATAGNNRRIHAVAAAEEDAFRTACGLRTPRRPQSTQAKLPHCRRCFG